MLLESVLQEVKLSEEEFLRVSKLVYEHCGINLHQGKKELVRARLAKRLRLCGLRSFSDYIDHAVSDTTGQEFSNMIDAICTNLTSFYREIEHFKFLEQSFLPALMEKKSKLGSNKIRAWSAGCSSGEEPYSLAITLLDAASQQVTWDVKILASDISTTILERAKAGIYDSRRLEPVTASQRQKYFHQQGSIYHVNSLLRGTVIFRYVNLMEQWPIGGPLDFIFCRNVMIYFDKPTQQKLIKRFHDILDSGGLLFTGHSESLTGIDHNFKYVRPTIYAKA